MNHLETVLRRAIVGLDPSDRDGRRIALGNVRGSLVRLLAVYDPPLSVAEIEAKIDEVDALIRVIEAEFAPPRRLPPAVAAVPAARADSDFEEEYEAGEEDYRDEDPDEGPFDEPDLDMPEDEGDRSAAETGRPAASRTGLVVAALIVLAVLVASLVFLTGEMRSAGMLQAVATDTDAPVEAAPQAVVPDVTPEVPAATPPASEPPEVAEPQPVAEPAGAAEPPAPAAPPPDAPTTMRATPAVPATPEPQAVAPPPGPQAAESLVLFDGRDPAAFKSTADNPVRFQGGTAGGFVQLASSPGSNGARLVVGPGVYQRIAGRSVRVVVVARGAPDNPATTLRLAYQNGRQLSSWSDQKLSGDFQSLAMNWQMPRERTGPDNDAILIEPGIPGDQTAADIRSVTIDVLP